MAPLQLSYRKWVAYPKLTFWEGYLLHRRARHSPFSYQGLSIGTMIQKTPSEKRKRRKNELAVWKKNLATKKKKIAAKEKKFWHKKPVFEFAAEIANLRKLTYKDFLNSEYWAYVRKLVLTVAIGEVKAAHNCLFNATILIRLLSCPIAC